ncbi:class III extradiol dioxygenase subunit B-like domain-containing protein [Klenkia terrae]|uniref:class III extradiol dioxygenase subunit B-like domain-containing protein n=1 Tax=Klenkia terrae TaxID=1052259 RepID=UPI001CD8C664|nr:class III extradiol dioxygenase subunit B-like domain-containing protein [Klenkia terrae]
MSPDPPPVAVAVAFCPHPPLLVPELEGTAAPETDRVRIACGEALQTVLGLRPDVVLVVGDGPPGVRYGPGDAGDLQPWGGSGRQPFAGRARPGGRRLPLAHTVGAWLLDQAGHDGLRLGSAPGDLAEALTDLPGPVGVLAMGDGSARRTAKAPGALDPAAAGFDAGVAEALRAGDPAALAALDVAEGHRLLAAGTDTWTAVGAALVGRAVTARLLLDDAPFGVGYLVADWLLADVPDGVPGWLQP